MSPRMLLPEPGFGPWSTVQAVPCPCSRSVLLLSVAGSTNVPAAHSVPSLATARPYRFVHRDPAEAGMLFTVQVPLLRLSISGRPPADGLSASPATQTRPPETAMASSMTEADAD